MYLLVASLEQDDILGYKLVTSRIEGSNDNPREAGNFLSREIGRNWN